MAYIRMVDNETIDVKESLDEIGKIINYRPQWIELTGSMDLNRIIVNINKILYLYDDGEDNV